MKIKRVSKQKKKKCLDSKVERKLRPKMQIMYLLVVRHEFSYQFSNNQIQKGNIITYTIHGARKIKNNQFFKR